MIGYWYTFEPYFLLGKTKTKNSFSAVPLNLTRLTELINQQFQKTKISQQIQNIVTKKW